jgi:ribose/xylose/arabinose/galactoside ABC-type transport system permease subunit
MLIERRELSIVVFMLALTAVLVAVNPDFVTLSNIRDIALNSSHLAIAALGMLLVMLIGQIDVSVGAILAICSTLAGILAKSGVPIPAAALLTILAGTTLGLINGAMVAGFRVHSIVVTLGSLSVFRGLLIYFTQGSWIYGLPQSFLAVGQGTLLGVPNPVLATVAVYLVGAWLLRATAFGRSLFAVGSNADAARLAGINVQWVQVATLSLNGALVGLASFLFASRFGVIQSNAGIGFEFAVITAVLLGGANIFGGSGTVTGTLLGAILSGAVATALVFLGVNAYWESAVQGLFILVAVALDRLRMLRPVTVAADAEQRP